jgi:hypothetical protein
MRVHILCAALGLTLATAAPAAAQMSPGAPAYDTDPAALDAPAGVAPGVGPGVPMPAYEYVYQPDRILVVDPMTGIAMQALPR